jgi:hypothetical protein
MNLHRLLIRPYFYTRYGFHRLTGTGAFKNRLSYPPRTEADRPYPPLKQALWQYHVKQFHASSCSVASVVACVNAIRALKEGSIQPIGQAEILDRVTTGHWKARMSDAGYRGRRGLPLPLLGQVVEESLRVYGLTVRQVDVVQTPKTKERRAPVVTILKRRLREFDQMGNGLIIAHFDQGAFVPTLNIPHISPVGAYDPSTDRVTLLDVDPDQKGPYQVSFDTFYKGLSDNYHHVLRGYGYGSGGYVYILL